MHPLVNIAVRAARAAGNVMMRHLDRLDTVRVVSKAPKDFVSDVDRQAEQAVISTIHRAYPDHAILAEESGAQGRNDVEWIIDPLDGTTNYLHGFPQFSVSIAVRQRGVVQHGVIYDPMREELFVASRGENARLNDRRIRVSRCTALDTALLGTGFPYRELEQLDRYMAALREFITATAGVRRPGSAALDLAYVAAGRLDGFFEFGLKPWDIAAGALMVREAGGYVTDLDGGELSLENGDVLAATPKVHAAMLDVMRASRA